MGRTAARCYQPQSPRQPAVYAGHRAAAVRAASAISFAAVFLNPGCEAVAGNMYVFVAFIVQDGGRGATGGV